MEEKLIDLDECVINALNLFIKKGVPKLDLGNFKRPLVVGSVNAAYTGAILFHDKDAVFADESTYKDKLNAVKNIDGAFLVNASGAKHGPIIAEDLKKKGFEVILLTCNPNAPASRFADKTFVFPKNPEPYSYNTSTYMGMIIAKTKENPQEILDFIKKEIDPCVPKNLADYDSYFFIIPEEVEGMRQMIITKFDEMFCPKISGRVFTIEQAKHAKNVILSDKELFVSFGKENIYFGNKKLDLPLPKNCSYAGMLAIAYYFVGKIQKQNPSWFKENIEEYCKRISKVFGSEVEVIVE